MGPKTRAKFRCVGVTKREHWDKSKGFLFAASLQPTTGGSPENDAFFASTPSGSIEISTVREDHFQVGQDYYVDFTLVSPS